MASCRTRSTPRGNGFVIAEVWRGETDGRPYVDDVLRPLVTGLGLNAHETSVRPIWSFARP